MKTTDDLVAAYLLTPPGLAKLKEAIQSAFAKAADHYEEKGDGFRMACARRMAGLPTFRSKR